MAEKMETFIAGKGRSIRFIKSVKYQPNSRGGLGILHLLGYYEAFQIAQVTNFIKEENTPEWAKMEMERKMNLIDLHVFTPRLVKKNIQIQNPFTDEAMRIWRKHMKIFAPPISPLCPCSEHPQLKPKNQNLQIECWKNIGIYRIKDLFVQGTRYLNENLNRQGWKSDIEYCWKISAEQMKTQGKKSLRTPNKDDK
ncbi:hypothetical protein JRQ81_018834 [Phrynocephalus forsythii]|uniref:Uncharacterized protein n=1 Tax=Phrynocephalus forsythii TaxID=171643 RepID=A0A9Q1B000_9SAUR|nr:hypothetical protein JRQ81_018834 [Phrynocephalus forsythii]